jgi:hypothetical protein
VDLRSASAAVAAASAAGGVGLAALVACQLASPSSMQQTATAMRCMQTPAWITTCTVTTAEMTTVTQTITTPLAGSQARAQGCHTCSSSSGSSISQQQLSRRHLMWQQLQQQLADHLP